MTHFQPLESRRLLDGTEPELTAQYTDVTIDRQAETVIVVDVDGGQHTEPLMSDLGQWFSRWLEGHGYGDFHHGPAFPGPTTQPASQPTN